jgi:NAD(P)-dependent dehydrogenase (short-subunit alcohol dehydrogenase family)
MWYATWKLSSDTRAAEGRTKGVAAVPRRLSDSVVVVTGASSGIGRATALGFIREGAAVVVAGRRLEALEELARECQEAGGRAAAYALDVAGGEAVQDLARYAVERFGRVDVWVNNAGVSSFGRFEQVPPDIFRRVIDTNLFGYVNGARAVLPYFREQGEGVLINVVSVAGLIGQPWTTPYVTSKWAVRGFSESLRMELALDLPHDIHVCTVLPASIDTPLFQHAANFSGRAPKPLGPVFDADMVAEKIIALAKRPKREVFAGPAGPPLRWQRILAPGITERVFASQVNADHFRDRPAPQTAGNLFEPLWGMEQVSGGWKQPSENRPLLYALPAVSTAVFGVLGWLVWRRNGGRRRSRVDEARHRLATALGPTQRKVERTVSESSREAAEQARRTVERARHRVGV